MLFDPRIVTRLASLLTDPNSRFRLDLRYLSPCNVIIPWYVYPDKQNPLLLDLIKNLAIRWPCIKPAVIVNPHNGPGKQIDPNYVWFIRTIKYVGGLVLGYVHTRYGTRAVKDVLYDIKQWKQLYPDIDGLFVDEVTRSETNRYYTTLTNFARKEGLYPVVLNTGAPPEDITLFHIADHVIVFENIHTQLPNWLDFLNNPILQQTKAYQRGVIVRLDLTQLFDINALVTEVKAIGQLVYIGPDYAQLLNNTDILYQIFDAICSAGGTTLPPPTGTVTVQ